MLTISIQAGGQSIRMGENKALMPFNGQPLIQRVWNRAAPLSDDLFITTSSPSIYTSMGLRCFPDVLPGRGALGGLVTAFHYAKHEVVAVVACDMPFLSADLLLAEYRILLREDVDVVIPVTEAGWEPLHAVYRANACLPASLRALQGGKKRLVSWLPEVRVREMTLAEIVGVDPKRLSFLNINTPEEFKAAEALVTQLGVD